MQRRKAAAFVRGKRGKPERNNSAFLFAAAEHYRTSTGFTQPAGGPPYITNLLPQIGPSQL